MKDGLKEMLSDLETAFKDSSEDSVRDKIKKSIDFLNIMIYEENKKEMYIEAATNLLHRRMHNISLINEEYLEDVGVWFEYYIAAHDYSAGIDSFTIRKQDIEIEIRDNALSKLLTIDEDM